MAAPANKRKPSSASGKKAPAKGARKPVGSSAKKKSNGTKAAGSVKRAPRKASGATRKPATRPSNQGKPIAKKPTGGNGGNGSGYVAVPAWKTALRVVGLSIIFLMVFLFIYIVAYIHGSAAINLEDYKSEQAQTSIIYAKDSGGDYKQIATLHGEQNRIWTDISDMPKDLQNAFISLEDKRFYKHEGVDWIRTIAAVIKYHGKQGGSTLTQQLIKNLTEENQVTVARKLKEILYALNLENNYSKEDILEAYLNTIPLGSGCYGVETAAEKYFGKDLKDLTTAECACLASITKAPTAYNPLLYPDNNKERRATCLRAMEDNKAITKEQLDKALAEDIIFTNSENYVPSKEHENTNTETKINSYYVDFVINQVIKDLMAKYNYSKVEATSKVYSGGLRIYSCENTAAQEAAEYVMVNRKTFPSDYGRTEDGADGTKKKVQSAVTIMDYSGHVVAMVGGAGQKTINRGLNRATDSARQPGSSIKPLSVYAPAIEEGILSYAAPILNCSLTINGKEWPQNFDGSHGSKYNRVSTQYAVAHSLNTCAAQVVNDMGTTKCFNYLKDNFHISTLIEDGVHTDNNISSLAVGGMSKGVTTIDMASAYATFGNGGLYYEPKSYTAVTDYKGEKTLLSDNQKPTKSLSPGTAWVMNRIMQTTVTEGTGVGCGVTGFTSFMKTGTTSDVKDKWACGGTPYFVAAVWYGYDQPEAITNISEGYNPAAHIWAAIMNRLHNGLNKKNFDYPDNIVAKEYCTRSGKLAGKNCPHETGYYDSDNLPGTCDGNHSNSMNNSGATTAATTVSKSSSETTTAAASEPAENPLTPSITVPQTPAEPQF